ncbi:TonB-dependent siderophore receptor [Geovibrio thiophilus]|uniref:TonB-dependent siderophore receptor n=2 Tax=Geovibrio thiophilus TaxID=139438 RepID=A0A410K2E1_9BACT|nr:TonB-dependent siderophore receptor [Geovibrio thiophilus]
MPLAAFAVILLSAGVYAAEQDTITLDAVEVVGTAEEQAKQSLGASIITKEDIEKRPPANDLSDIIRRQPGVNLTGNTATGMRGNNRQIDLRGMGPENTLILIDGRPVMSRSSVRYGWDGERDTRGDTNWVPAEMVERIEILRGPAAARYGSGAMGGVVNIITKKPEDKLTGSMSFYTNMPEDSKEGGNKRVNVSVSGPVSNSLSFRVYGSRSESEGDAPDINSDAIDTDSDTSIIAGREGVNNKDINAILSWVVNKQQIIDFGASYSRQGNEYAGDALLGAVGAGDAAARSMLGEETNIMRRRSYFVTHSGNWDWGSSRVDLSYEGTDNVRLDEGLAGGSEGKINTAENWNLTELENYRAKAEVNIPVVLFGFHQTATLGAEYLKEKMKDPGNTGRNATTTAPDYEAGNSELEQYSYAAYVEDNIYLGHGVTLTPGVRMDYHEIFGSNASPSLNAMWELNKNWTVKGGIARAYKAPNLYQGNPNYLLSSNGNGCAYRNPSGSSSCYLLGNDDLEPEISINKEIGLAFESDIFNASATYFRNDYDSKIYAGTEPVDYTDRYVYQWQNAEDAIVEGVEGNVFVAVGKDIDFNTNITYMIKNETKKDGQPLSIVPEYTINSFVDWRATDSLLLGVNATYYGKQEPRTLNYKRPDVPLSEEAMENRDPYYIFGIYGTYKIIDTITFKAGINNLFDKQLYREGNAYSVTSGAGAGGDTYNEPGRSYYVSMTMDF